MRIVPTALPEVLLIEPVVHGDERGYFFEAFHQARFDAALGYRVTFVQDNESRSKRGVLRGLHYQLPPHAQGKLVRCAEGAIYDVAVDIRKRSPTFGQWVGVELSDANKRQLWIPPGFAHGFLTLTDFARLLYKATDYYAPECDRAIAWNDPQLAIAWPELDVPLIISEKDRRAPRFADAEWFD
jgi:dTDP-4-dehydrorhamnose 3,5-epimerase